MRRRCYWATTRIANEAAQWIKLPYTQIQLLPISHPKRGEMVLVKSQLFEL